MKITKETPLDEVRLLGEKCDQCGKCCSYGSGFMLESEITKIAAFLDIPKENFIRDFLEETEIFHTKIFKIKPYKPKGRPFGPCMLLHDNKCSIHDVKPLHCSIGNCKEHGDDLHVWFIVNYCLNIYDPESIRQYNTYINTGGRLIPGAELEKVFPDKHKLKRILDYDIIR